VPTRQILLNIANTTIYAWLTSSTRDQQARRFFASHRVV